MDIGSNKKMSFFYARYLSILDIRRLPFPILLPGSLDG